MKKVYQDSRPLLEEIDLLLEITTFEDILNDNQMTISEALLILWETGQIQLPDWRPDV